MKYLALTFVLIATALADVSELSGYNYNRPSGSYIPPSGQATSPHITSQPSGSYIPSSSSNIFNQATQPSGSYIPSGNSNNFGQGTQPSGSYLPGGGSNNFGNHGGPGNGYDSGSGGSYNPNVVQDQKHVYFYAAPDDEAPARLRINVGASNQKNTKIIFIKAPSQGGLVPEIINPPSQAEDKTVVYVLVKKQEQAGDINIPASAGVKQAKPEVYFIKYKNPQEGERAVSESLGGHPAGSSLQPLNDANAFVRTLKDSPQHGGIGGSGHGDNGLGGHGLGNNGLGSHGLGNNGLGNNGLGGNGLGSNGLGSNEGLGTSYGPPGASGPY